MRQPATAPVMLALYSVSNQDTVFGVDCSHRAIAGNDAPMSTVGGSRHAAATSPCMTRLSMPNVGLVRYTRLSVGKPNSVIMLNVAIFNSRHAYTMSGFRCQETSCGMTALPIHNPP